MGEEKEIFQEMGLKDSRQVRWAALKKDENSKSMESFSINDSEASSSSFSLSADLADDASSSSSTPSPLYELAELMAQFPIKRGLSKYYDGKSQAFGSLASVKSVEDLAKESCYSKRMKLCKSYGENLNHQHQFGPKPTITKRSQKGSFSPFLPSKGPVLVN